jgi:hypothetical protein
LLADSQQACVQVRILPAQAEDLAAARADGSRRNNGANSRIKLPVMSFQRTLGADARDQPPSGQRPGGHPKGAKAMFLIILIIIVIIAAAVMLRRRFH